MVTGTVKGSRCWELWAGSEDSGKSGGEGRGGEVMPVPEHQIWILGIKMPRGGNCHKKAEHDTSWAGKSEREGPVHQSREGQTDSHPNIDASAAEDCGEGVMAEGFQGKQFFNLNYSILQP